jgi:hypothetical protein
MSALDSGAHGGGVFPRRRAKQLFAPEALHPYPQIYAVHQGPGYAVPIPSDVEGTAPAFLVAVICIAAHARIHRRYQGESTIKAHGSTASRDPDDPVLQRTAQTLENLRPIERKLIEEENAICGKAYLAGPRKTGAPADHPGKRNAVMGGTKGSIDDKGRLLAEEPSYRVKFRESERLPFRHAWENPG